MPTSAKFVRSGTDVHMLQDNEHPPAGGEPMLRLVQREGCYWVDKATPASSSKKLWVVVRDLATSGHKLSEGDVIKPGARKQRGHGNRTIIFNTKHSYRYTIL